MDKLENARNKINDIDKKMASLFCERMEAVKAVAEYKAEHGLPIFDSSREAQVIKNNEVFVSDPTLREYYINFLQKIMDISKSYQSRLQSGLVVAYSGVEGAFAHIAAHKHFPSAKLISFESFKDAYNAVVRGECDTAVLPLENSYAGEVGQVMDLIFSGPLYVNSVLELAVTHNLIAIPGAKIEDITDVFSHPQALAQCAKYIKENNFNQNSYTNTALAALYVKEQNNPHYAAIASRETAELYGLRVLDHDINSSRSNTTRFGIFSRAENSSLKEANERFILVFTVKNEAGALAEIVHIIGKYGYNMINLRSRPMKELLWQYYFFVEAEGNINSENGKEMLKELSSSCDKLKLVGSYSKFSDDQ